MKRWKLLLLCAVIGLAGIAVWYWLTTPAPGPTLAKFRRLNAGMKLQEIKDLMGRPPDLQAYSTLAMNYVWFESDGTVLVTEGLASSISGRYWPATRSDDRIAQLRTSRRDAMNEYGGQYDYPCLSLAEPQESWLSKLRRYLRI